MYHYGHAPQANLVHACVIIETSKLLNCAQPVVEHKREGHGLILRPHATCLEGKGILPKMHREYKTKSYTKKSSMPVQK